MNAQSSTVPEFGADAPASAPAATAPTRPLYWSIRREFWESRSIFIAPLAVAALVLLALLVSAVRLPQGVRLLEALDPARRDAIIAGAFGMAAFPITITTFLVAVFYCLGALHNERRDRSILFWKSLPVSDLVTVVSKASIPLVIIPIVTVVIIIATRLIMLLMGTAVVAANGLSLAPLWDHPPLLQLSLVPLYGVAVQTLWYAPIYGWLMLVSGWARRAPFLWAVIPPLALCLFEKIAFHTSYLTSMLENRLTGSDAAAFVDGGPNAVIYKLAQLDPAKFVATPGLWIGLAIAAVLFAAAVWLRRYRDPV